MDGNPDNLNATEGEEILPSTNNYVDDEEYGQEEMPRSQKTNHHVVDDDDDDDGFYDITGEPVIVQPPLVRAKSVKIPLNVQVDIQNHLKINITIILMILKIIIMGKTSW